MRNKFFATALVLPVIASISLSACTSTNPDMTKLEQRVSNLETETQTLKAQLAAQNKVNTPIAVAPAGTELASAAAGLAAVAPVAPAQQIPGTAAVAGAFTDIAGVYGEKEIKDLAKLGVFNDIQGNFNPSKQVTRAEFVAWLVKSNNVIRPKEDHIRVADAGASPSFPDLKSNHKYFSYIEGMNSAGFSVGYADKTFKPEKALTREEMIAIKNPLDHGNGQYGDYERRWTDGDKISPEFKIYMSDENFGDTNWTRVFGKTKACHPQQVVTRAEAALCVWQIGWHHKYQADKPEV